MKSGAQATKEIARYLSDLEDGYEHVHWSEEDLFQYYRLAISLAASWNKRDFSVKTEVKVVGGAVQTLPPPCQGVADTIYTDAAGRLLPSKSVDTMSKSVPLKCAPATYKPTGVAVDPMNNNIVMVDPPVPMGQEATIFVNCFVAPTPNTPEEEVKLPTHLEPLVFELMLYYAWGVDTESAPSRDRSSFHWQNAVFIVSTLSGVITRKPTRG